MWLFKSGNNTVETVEEALAGCRLKPGRIGLSAGRIVLWVVSNVRNRLYIPKYPARGNF